jgi:16S rRNA (guanine966-N2)-methyltransferase
MRVIGGELRSRRLKTLPGVATRPTPDRLRETLFDILAPRIEGTLFVDAYAGTGSVGIEALSRGARECVFIEKNHAAVDVIRQNVTSLGLDERAQVIRGKTTVVFARIKAEIVFLDPPYNLENEYAAALNALGPAPPALAIAQHTVHFPLAEAYGPLRRFREVKQGDNILTFYRCVVP